MDTIYSLKSSSVSSGSHSPLRLNAFSPVSTSRHVIFLLPLYAFSTAASKTIWEPSRYRVPCRLLR